METSRLTQVSAMTLMKVAAVKKVSCAASFRLVLFCEQVDCCCLYLEQTVITEHCSLRFGCSFLLLKKIVWKMTQTIFIL